jgi:hypothetical protein
MSKKLTIKALCEDSPWEIAKRLGIGYFGDMNPFNHNGHFYSTADWAEYGYASCVRISHYDGLICAESGTIRKPDDLSDAFRCGGWERDDEDPSKLVQGGYVIDITPDVEIECVMDYYGMEVDQDFTGDYRVTMPEDCNERTFWKSVIGWIRGLEPAKI